MLVVRVVSSGALAVGVLLGVGACGSKQPAVTLPASSPAARATLSPEDLRAPDPEVAHGLTVLKGIVAGVVDALVGGDKARATDTRDQIEPVWSSIEGTVKANEPDTYLTFEDQWAKIAKAIETADSAMAKGAAEVVVRTVDAYLSRHPGGPATSSPGESATPTASPNSSPAESGLPVASQRPGAPRY